MFSAVYNTLSSIFSTSAPPLARIAQRELLHDDAMLEVLSYLQPRELAQAARVCIQWHALIGQSAYRSISLDDRQRSSHLLVRTLLRNDRILSHVRHITVVLYTKQRDSEYDGFNILDWMKEYDSLSLVKWLPKIPNIRTFCVVGNHVLLKKLLSEAPVLRTVPHIELSYLQMSPASKSIPSYPGPVPLHSPDILPAIEDILCIDATLMKKAMLTLTLSSESSYSTTSSFQPDAYCAYLREYLEFVQNACRDLDQMLWEVWYGSVPPHGGTFADGIMHTRSACLCEDGGQFLQSLGVYGSNVQQMVLVGAGRPPCGLADLAQVLQNVHRRYSLRPSGMRVQVEHGARTTSWVCDNCGVRLVGIMK